MKGKRQSSRRGQQRQPPADRITGLNRLATRLSADRPVLWELELNLDVPGLDFKQTYLVPIYNSKAAPGTKPILLNR